MINFNDIGDKHLGEIEKPPLVPVGTYRFKITKVPEQTTSGNGEWDIVNFTCKIEEAVDVDDAESFNGDLRKQFMRHSIMFNKQDQAEFDKSLDRLKTFLVKTLKCGDESDTLKQSMANAMGCEFLATVGWRAMKDDPEDIRAEIKKTAPLE